MSNTIDIDDLSITHILWSKLHSINCKINRDEWTAFNKLQNQFVYKNEILPIQIVDNIIIIVTFSYRITLVTGSTITVTIVYNISYVILDLF